MYLCVARDFILLLFQSIVSIWRSHWIQSTRSFSFFLLFSLNKSARCTRYVWCVCCSACNTEHFAQLELSFVFRVCLCMNEAVWFIFWLCWLLLFARQVNDVHAKYTQLVRFEWGACIGIYNFFCNRMPPSCCGSRLKIPIHDTDTHYITPQQIVAAIKITCKLK